MVKNRKENCIKKARRVRAKILTLKTYPRLSVYRSNKHIYAQVIDDKKGITLAASSDLTKELSKTKTSKTERASSVGESLAKIAVKKKVSKVVFDKGGYKYGGRVRALADGARKGGLKF
ncbi:50S ribosomal protein L18 [Candidatus Woesebacteria bacterium RIFCSPLOWO2_01_FULL_39_23]|uniref:Large ribosomal subunit protein uL18 n=3 Tax=Microgenomates group TaxID=1794810 RepID=A0A0H4TX32_9BACT|nr:50S ribosomal protein L18, large subunit ribosomal protein L18 [uncultured Microgenomates bacterium Rifle_16ft_4_minimus_37633]AKQ05534.1 50S ribosomal protein L18, large subunit ribosomal protein L18 [uncultured Microgenomates bacterium Rifle_16ft_4_minimus_24053]OGM13888.1 MAG: 50S ribosomal protein L18 [Candidatus Woesebacteria bacterium RBG_16_40_11]OGM27840.1 MAG: 50S ribosomal protein L18 [Candidatus Woesebacteria bacterium RIFCSPHIGHO2_01_FULL_40_22]OGM36303.1 MAG: 50S ribosomal prote